MQVAKRNLRLAGHLKNVRPDLKSIKVKMIFILKISLEVIKVVAAYDTKKIMQFVNFFEQLKAATIAANIMAFCYAGIRISHLDVQIVNSKLCLVTELII